MKRCHKCGWVWPEDRGRPGIRASCPQCTAYLHSCRNCHHHDPKLHNECRVPGTEMVADRGDMNYCDDFVFADREVETPDTAAFDQARATLDSVFGTDSAGNDAAAAARDFLGHSKEAKDPRKALDDLFGG